MNRLTFIAILIAYMASCIGLVDAQWRHNMLGFVACILGLLVGLNLIAFCTSIFRREQ